MQTFLPSADFELCARAHHPAVLMWKGYEEALGRYGLACCRRWTELGFADTCAATIVLDLGSAGAHSIRGQAELARGGALPPWLGDEALHVSHQAALLSKDRDWYAGRFPGVSADVPYLWPVRSEQVLAAEQRKADNAARRQSRAAERAQQDAERARRRRSRAAQRGWETRRANRDTIG